MGKAVYDHNIRVHTYFGISHRPYKRVRMSKVLYQTKKYDIHLFVVRKPVDIRYVSECSQPLGRIKLTAPDDIE